MESNYTSVSPNPHVVCFVQWCQEVEICPIHFVFINQQQWKPIVAF